MTLGRGIRSHRHTSVDNETIPKQKNQITATYHTTALSIKTPRAIFENESPSRDALSLSRSENWHASANRVDANIKIFYSLLFSFPHIYPY